MLTRRQLLLGAATVLVSAGGCARLTRQEAAADEGPRPFRVALLSDPHTVVSAGGNGKFGQALAELKAIMKQHPQIKLWLSGHTHMGAAIAGNVARKDGITYVGLGSTCYQFVPATGKDAVYSGFAKDLSACESRMLEVWPDRMVIRARNHAQKAWLDDQELTITLAGRSHQ